MLVYPENYLSDSKKRTAFKSCEVSRFSIDSRTLRVWLLELEPRQTFERAILSKAALPNRGGIKGGGNERNAAREENDLASVRDALAHVSGTRARVRFCARARARGYSTYPTYVRDINGRTRDTRPCNHLGEACHRDTETCSFLRGA